MEADDTSRLVSPRTFKRYRAIKYELYDPLELIKAVSFREGKKNSLFRSLSFQVRHKVSKAVYAMKLLSKFEMVRTCTLNVLTDLV